MGNFRKFRTLQWNSVEFSMALNMNSMEIAGGFRGSARFLAKIWNWGGSGQFGVSKKLLRKQAGGTGVLKGEAGTGAVRGLCNRLGLGGGAHCEEVMHVKYLFYMEASGVFGSREGRHSWFLGMNLFGM